MKTIQIEEEDLDKKETEREAKKVWNKIFYRREDCQWFFKDFCIWELRQDDVLWDKIYCSGVCEHFELRKRELPSAKLLKKIMRGAKCKRSLDVAQE